MKEGVRCDVKTCAKTCERRGEMGDGEEIGTGLKGSPALEAVIDRRSSVARTFCTLYRNR